jgi:hypothetical protein
MPNKKEYLKYLQENGLDESDVLPVLHDDFKDRFKEKISSEEMMKAVIDIALSASKGDKEAVEYAKKMTTMFGLINNNANEFINEVIKKNLHEHCQMADINLPDNLYVGIFPVDSYNAHIVKRGNGFLVLINTGFIELVESIVEVSQYQLDTEIKAKIINKWIIDYLKNSKIPTVHEREEIADKLNVKGKSENGLVNYLITAAEEFVLLHEYGHYALNHLAEKNFQNDRVYYSHKREYEADLWALNIQIIKSNRLADEYMRAIKIFGIYAFLGIGALIEKYLVELFGQQIGNSHPSCSKRIWNLEAFLKSFGYLEDCYLGTNLMKVMDEASNSLLESNLSDKIPIFDTGIVGVIDNFINTQKIQDADRSWYLNFARKFESVTEGKEWAMYQDGHQNVQIVLHT